MTFRHGGHGLAPAFLGVGLLLAGAESAHAFPPYRTTDAETAGDDTLEARIGLLRLQVRVSHSNRRTPLSRVNYGVGPHFEVISELEYAIDVASCAELSRAQRLLWTSARKRAKAPRRCRAVDQSQRAISSSTKPRARYASLPRMAHVLHPTLPGRNRMSTTLERPRGTQDAARSGWWSIARRVKDDIAADNLSLIAAGAAFFALLAMFPALAAGVALYGLFTDPATVTAHSALLTVLRRKRRA